jgi:serine/threonine protein kinase
LSDSLACLTTPPVGGGTRTRRLGQRTETGLRFRVLRPHARGGLGEVFVAHDGELNREVALKEMQDQFAADPGSRVRFLLEAEVTGGLEHTGIVPVYSLGQYADGRPFYAMRALLQNLSEWQDGEDRQPPAFARLPFSEVLQQSPVGS